MGVLLTIVGIAIIVLGLRDMYHSLLYPSGRKALSYGVMSGVWKLSKATGHRFGSVIGPAAMATAVVLWVALQGLGWALIYYPHVPGGFAYSPGVNPGDYNSFAEALYISLVSLATVGYGDVVATDPWIRLTSPLEALTGFALLTTALTWFTQIYPVLSHRRALALELKFLADARYAEALGGLDPIGVSRVLDSLTADVAKARVDLTQHTESYYFQEDDPDLSLPRQASYMLVLAEAAAAALAPQVRASAQRLTGALEQLGQKLDADFLRTDEDDVERVLQAYAHDHAQQVRR